MVTRQNRCAGHTKSAWEKMRPLITKLYTEDNLSVKQLITKLAEVDIIVNKRMIMTRIMAWGIGRNHRHSEMLYAVRLVLEDLNTLSGKTTFTIRGQTVYLSEIKTYFKRRGVIDIKEYVDHLPVEENTGPPEVKLSHQVPWLSENSEHSHSSTSGGSQEATPSPLAKSTGRILSTVDNAAQTPRYGDIDEYHTLHLTINTTCRTSDRLLWAIATYNNAYNNMTRRTFVKEPQVHHLTVHGKFGHYMQEGITLMTQNNSNAAFMSFHRSFEFILPLLTKIQPMSLMLVFTIVCELLKHGLRDLVVQIVKHVLDIYNLREDPNHPVAMLFSALAGFEGLKDMTQQALRVVRRTCDDLTISKGELDWQSLYVKERMCDALYYAGESCERMAKRRELWEDQKKYYHPNARNVLWTQANVADDFRMSGDLDQARTVYTDLLERAEDLEDFGRAKTRFAALEGLASLYISQSCLTGLTQASMEALRTQALEYLNLAEKEALLWFNTSNRRVQRVQDQKRCVLKMLKIQMTSESETDC